MLHARLRAAAGRDRIPTDGLVVWYTMDNVSGSTLVDEMGSYDGTITGATQTTGVIGQALSFDGNDYCESVDVSGTAISDPSISGALAVSFFMYGEGGDYVITTGGHTSSRGFSYLNRNPAVALLKDGSTEWIDESLQRANQNTWVHVLMNWDGSTLKVFYDGIEVSSVSGVTNTLSDTQTKISIGRPNGVSSNFFLGKLDQLRIYNRSLSNSEISALSGEGQT